MCLHLKQTNIWRRCRSQTDEDNTDKERCKERCKTNSGKEGSLLWLFIKSDILLSEGEGVLSSLLSSSVDAEGLLMKVPTNTWSTVDDDDDEDDDDDRVDADGKGLWVLDSLSSTVASRETKKSDNKKKDTKRNFFDVIFWYQSFVTWMYGNILKCERRLTEVLFQFVKVSESRMGNQSIFSSKKWYTAKHLHSFFFFSTQRGSWETESGVPCLVSKSCSRKTVLITRVRSKRNKTSGLVVCI